MNKLRHSKLLKKVNDIVYYRFNVDFIKLFLDNADKYEDMLKRCPLLKSLKLIRTSNSIFQTDFFIKPR